MSSSLIGHTLGHYRILDQLGAGGMGVVYRAQDLKLGRQVAIKVLPTGTDAPGDAVERFRREARTASALNHPNICTIYGFDDHDGQCYLAMELLDGEPLDSRLAGRALDLRSLLDFGIQIADALDAAHAEGILHRDIKPANIFITRRGQVKVLDFGLAKLTPGARRGHSDVIETRAEHFSSIVGTTVGTIAYMSPEQARGEELDPRTDLFSFGVVLYEMATGRQSFPGHTTAVVFDGILNRDPAPPSSINSALPPDIDRIVGKALEKDRTLRYQTAADLRADLQRLRRDSGSRRVAVAGSSAVFDSGVTVVAPPSAAAVGAITPPPSTPSAPYTPSLPTLTGIDISGVAGEPAKTSPPWPLIGLVALGLLAVASAFYLMSRGDEPAAAPVEVVAEAPALDAVGDAAPVTPPSTLPSPGSTLDTSTPAPATSTPAPPVAPAVIPPPAKAPSKMPDTPVASAPAAPDTAAIQRLEIARAKLANNLLDQGLTDLRQIVADYPRSPFAADAALLIAESLDRANRADDAMAAYVEFDKRFAGHPRVPESQLRRAQLLLRSRAQQRQTEGYALLGQIARSFPGSSQSRQALQSKRQMEVQRRQLRDTDPVLNTQVPALMVTLRMFADQFPNDPEAMPALNQLAGAYSDMDRHDLAAQVWERMAAQFPNNPVEVYFRLGELYERRLRDPGKARASYAKVPPNSPRYKEAQQRLNRK
ncbi:MAG: protein kinase [Acidobacteria bacterium]|nr:protein kinase [Acidobacteriota bacterium]